MEESEKKSFDIHYYIRMIIRRKWLFILPFLALYIPFLVASFALPKVYQARSTVLIEEKKVVNPLLQNLAISTTVGERITALREEILAWPRLFQLVERLELNKDVQGAIELERLISKIRENISLTLKSKEILQISYFGEDPSNAQKLVNTLCDILIQRNIDIQTEDTESAIDFIKEQLDVYKEKLNSAEKSLRQFKEIYGMGMVAGQSDSSDDNSSMLEDTTGSGVALYKINKELSDLEAELVMASIDCTDEHPRIKGLKQRIKTLKEKRIKYIKEVAEKAGVEPEAYVEIADSSPRQTEELVRLTRDRAINEKIYEMLLQRLETAKITDNLDSSENKTKFRIIEPARLPLVPVKPNKIKINILGFILALVVAFGVVYIFEYSDSSFKTSEGLKEAFNIPVLGNISKIVTEEETQEQKDLRKKVVKMFSIFLGVIILIIIIVLRFMG